MRLRDGELAYLIRSIWVWVQLVHVSSTPTGQGGAVNLP
jgi:hypothetical protein